MVTPSVFQSIFGSLSQVAPISPEVIEVMSAYFQHRRLRRKEHWLAPGEYCDSVAFIARGCLRIYFPSEGGSERSARFFFEGGWMSDYESVNTRQRSTLGIDALENSELYVIRYDDIESLYDRFPQLERIGRLIAEQNVIDLCKRYRSLLHDSPLTRYVNLIEQQPEVVDRIPQHYIASFLGIEPESLSRIRKKLASEASNAVVSSSHLS
jgi:CRP-like cAMP-binding protein